MQGLMVYSKTTFNFPVLDGLLLKKVDDSFHASKNMNWNEKRYQPHTNHIPTTYTTDHIPTTYTTDHIPTTYRPPNRPHTDRSTCSLLPSLFSVHPSVGCAQTRPGGAACDRWGSCHPASLGQESAGTLPGVPVIDCERVRTVTVCNSEIQRNVVTVVPREKNSKGLTLSLPRVINFKFLLHPHQNYYTTHYGELGVS